MNILPVYIILITSLLVSCSRDYKIAKIIPGKTSMTETLELLDEPIRAKTSTFNEKVEVFIWKDVTVQFQKSRVFAVHRTPSSIESSLQFWRHRFKNDAETLYPVKDVIGAEKLWQMDFKGHGLSVIYNERDDKVVKVIHYEAK